MHGCMVAVVVKAVCIGDKLANHGNMQRKRANKIRWIAFRLCTVIT